MADGRPLDPGELRRTAAGWQLFYGRAHWSDGTDTWIDVPAEAVLPQASPLVLPVAWISRGHVYCLALAGAM